MEDLKHILIGFAGAAILAVYGFARRNRDGEIVQSPPNREAFLMATVLTLVAIIIRLVHLSILYRSGFIASEADEFLRWSNCVGWSNDPFFFTNWDGVWLSGGFAFHGFFMRLLDDPLRGMQAGNLMAQMLTLGSISFAGGVLSGRPICGAWAALLASIGFPFTFIGMGPLVEGLLGGAVCFTVGSFVMLLRSNSDGRRRLLWASGTALGLFSVTSLHYNGWMAIILGSPIALGGLWIRRRQFGRQLWLVLAILLLGALTFPVAWMIGSNEYLGSPLAFLRNMIRLNTEQMPHMLRGETNPLWVYPKLYWSQAGGLIPLLLLAALPGWGASRGLRWERIAASFLVIGFVIVTSVRAELSGFYPSFHRYLIIPYAMGVSVAGAAFGVLPPLRAPLGNTRSWLRRMASVSAFAVGTLGFTYGWVRHNLEMTKEPLRHVSAKEWGHDIIALSMWLQAEMNIPQTLSRSELRRPIGFYAERYNSESAKLVGFFGDRRDTLRLIPAEVWPAVPPDLNLVFSNAPEIPMGFTPVTQFGSYRVLRRSSQYAN